MTGLAAYLTLTVVIPALLLGHQGEDFPPFMWWRTVRARQARARGCAPAGAPHAPFRLPRHLRGASEASQPPSRPAPSWARTDKEAA